MVLDAGVATYSFSSAEILPSPAHSRCTLRLWRHTAWMCCVWYCVAYDENSAHNVEQWRCHLFDASSAVKSAVSGTIIGVCFTEGKEAGEVF